MQKNVAVILAHSGAELVFSFVIPDQIFSILQRFGNHVPATCPFAKINHAAAIAAKREVGVGVLDHRFLASRALQVQAAFWHGEFLSSFNQALLF